MWHLIFIAAHAAGGAIALLAGSVAIARGALFRTYLAALVTMEIALVAAIAVEWGVVDTTASLLFIAFAVLGAFMVWRADQARRIRPSGSVPAPPSARYVAHVGFTLVGLLDAFVVILVLNAGAPGWAVVAAGVLIAVAGHFVLRVLRHQLVERVRRPARAVAAG